MVLKKQKSKIQKRLNKLKQKGGEATTMTPGMPPMPSISPEMMKGSMPPMPSMSPDMMAMIKASMGPPMTGGYRKKSSRKSKQNKSRKNKSQKKSKNLTKKNRKH